MQACIHELNLIHKTLQLYFYEQLRHCSTLFVNKIDKIEVEETARLLRQLERLNSDANIQVGQFGELNLKSLLEHTYKFKCMWHFA